jgi:hypothetical protein
VSDDGARFGIGQKEGGRMKFAVTMGWTDEGGKGRMAAQREVECEDLAAAMEFVNDTLDDPDICVLPVDELHIMPEGQ